MTPGQLTTALTWLASDQFVMVARGLKMTRRDAIRMKLGAALRAVASVPGADITEARAAFAGDEATLRTLAADETEHAAAREGARRILGG